MTPPSTGETSEPGIVASFAGFGSTSPVERRLSSQLVCSPNFEVMREWNRAVVYRKTIGLFADRIGGR